MKISLFKEGCDDMMMMVTNNVVYSSTLPTYSCKIRAGWVAQLEKAEVSLSARRANRHNSPLQLVVGQKTARPSRGRHLLKEWHQLSQLLVVPLSTPVFHKDREKGKCTGPVRKTKWLSIFKWEVKEV